MGSRRNREKAAGAKARARGKAKVRPRAQPPVEKVRHKAQKMVETNFAITTVKYKRHTSVLA